MTDKPTGGPAFPMQDSQAIHAYAQAKVELLSSARADKPLSTNERDAEYIQARAEAIGGMTVRDYFAGKALQGLVASCTNGQEVAPGLGAKWCYEMADAMLEARNA